MASRLLCFFCGAAAITAVTEVGQADRSDATCADISAAQVARGSALLQVKRAQTDERAVLGPIAPDYSHSINQANRTCSIVADPFTATLDASGFLAVTSTCCAWKMEAFFIRLLESLGYRVCSKPHVQGLMHWLTCVPATDFEYVLSIIANGNEHGCKFWALTDKKCPAILGTKCDGNKCTGGTDPFNSSLDAAGFLAVTSTCCPWKTEVFFNLLLDSLGYKVCSKPHVQGLMHWFTCTPAMDFQYILNIIHNGNEHGCKFWAPADDKCPAIVGTKCDNPCKPEATTTPALGTTAAPTTALATTTLASGTTALPTVTMAGLTFGTTAAPRTTEATGTAETTKRTTTTSTTTTEFLNTTCCMEKGASKGDDSKWRVPDLALAAKREYIAASATPKIGNTRNTAVPSSVKPWNCSAVDGPVQVITDYATGPFTNVSQLNVVTGEYELLFQIPTNTTQPEMTKFINSAAINPVDGIAYATVPIGDDYYIVRFNADTLEFVAKLPESGDITGNYKKNHYFVGAFGWDGTYFIGAEGNLLAIEDVALMQGFDSQTDSGLEQVTNKTAPSFEFPGYYADIVIGMGDFDNSGSTSQWIFGLSGNSQLSLGKLPLDISNTAAIETYKLQATNALDNPGGSAASFGAGWNYQDLIFFSRNNGDGIFQVETDTMNLDDLTYSLSHAGASRPTEKNDGMGCMETINPWFCTSSESEFLAAGSCPSYARPVVGVRSA